MLSIEKRITALIRKLQKNKVFQSRWYKALTALAIVVVFCTTYALILPAVTLTGDPNCGEEEHTHTDACIGEVLICGYDDAGAPQAMALSAAHTDPFEPICGKEEHIHTDECYELQNVKVCLNEDPTHQHDDTCFVEELVLTCRQKEHVHGPECYPAPEEPDEQEPHVHTDACYAEEYICGQTEHTHTDACYAEPDETEDTSEVAAAEDEEDANSTIAKPWEIALSLTGDTKADIVRVAESQLGYKESTEDYIEDTLSGSAQGYTIYGDWYGEPYGEWSAIFAAYCLNQAGVDEFDFPYESDPLFWMEDLRSAGLLKNLRYTPEEGDLVFLDTDTDGMADKVGIINEIDAWSELFTCVVGDSDNRVEEQEYFTMDFEVLAYAAVRGDEFAMPDIDSDMKPGALDDMDSADVELELDSIFDAIPELPEDVAASEAFDEMYGELPAASELADGEPDASSTLPEMSAPARPLSTEVFTYKDEDVRIAVTLPAGAAVPADATLEVTPVTAFDADYGMIQSLAQEALDDSLAQEYLAELEAWGLLTDSVDQNAGKAIIGDLTYYNVCFVTADGDTLPLEEGAQVTVRFADGVLPVAVDTADYSVLVYSDDGSIAAAPETLATEWTSSAIRFTAADSISGFAVVSSEEYNTASIRGVTADDGSARVVVELPDGSSVPQAASLSVTRVLPGEPAYDYYRLLDQANEKLAGIEDVVLYDISFTLDDMTYDVPDTAQVSIRLLDDSLLLESEQEAAVLRYGHSSELPGIVSARAYLDAGSPVIAFETEGFAVFGIAKVSESDLGGTYAIIAQTEADPDALAEDAEPYNYYALTANEQTVGIVTGLQGAEVTMNDSGEPVAAQNAGVAFWKLEKAQETENGSAAYTVQEAESGAYLNMDAAGALTLTTEPQEFTLAQSGDGTVTLTTEDATLALLETEDEGENLFAADSTDSATFGTPVTALSLYDTLLVADENALDAYNTEPVTLTSEDEDAGYIVTVTYDADANLPEGTTLSVSEYDQDSDTYAARYAEAAALYGWDAESEDEDEDAEENTLVETFVEIVSEDAEDDTAEETEEETTVTTHSLRLFDITLYDADGAEVEPEAPVAATITLADVSEEITDYTIIHFVDDYAENAGVMLLALDDEAETAGTIEEMEPETEYDAAAMTQTFSFETQSFSLYGVATASEENSDENDITLLAASDGYTFKYYSTSSENPWGGSSTTTLRGTYTVYIVDTDGNVINTVEVDESKLTYTQGNNSNNGYSLSTLASYFTVTVNGTQYSYSAAYLDSSLTTAVTSIRYNNNSMQYTSSSNNGPSSNNWSTLSSSTIYLVYRDASDLSSTSFSHIDVKVALAKSDSSTVDYTLYMVTSITAGDTTETNNQTSSSYEWSFFRHNFTGSTDITISYTVSYVENGETKYKTYTAVLTSDSTYADGTYYPYNGNNAYKLYNYLYGTSYNSNEALYNEGITQVDISGRNIYLVAAILCNGSSISGQTLTKTDGLDFALDVGTLMQYSANFDLEVEKTYGGADLTSGLFSFSLYSATVDETAGYWTQGNTPLETASTGNAVQVNGSATDTISFEQITYESSTDGTVTYYYILKEDSGSESNVTYDNTVYGIKVVVTTTSTTAGTGSTTIYTAEVESTTYYTLQENSDGTYTAAEINASELENKGINTTGKLPVFSFTNTYNSNASITLKKVDSSNSDGDALSGAVFTITNSSGQYGSVADDGTVTWTTVEEGDTTPTITLGTKSLTLSDGTYTLTEVTAPNGYNLLTSPITFTVSSGKVEVTGGDQDSTGAYMAVVSDDVVTITIKNTAGNVLPSTGGRGTRGYTIAGMILICSAAYVLYRTMRKRKEGV